MKRKNLANLIMVAVIAVIATAGILASGWYLGWFDQADGTQALLTNIRGIVSLQRDGVSYTVQEDTVLRAGDEITCTSGATAVLAAKDSTFTLANSARVQITDAGADSFCVQVVTGEVFANVQMPARLTFDGQTAELKDCVAMLSVRSGAQTLSIFAGTVGQAQAGQTMNWIGGEQSIGKLTLESLNDFSISQVRAANKTRTLCFTDEQLAQLEADRWAQLQASREPATQPPTEPPTQTTEPTEAAATAAPTQAPTQAPTAAPIQVPTQAPTQAPTEAPTDPPAFAGYVTITIRCDTILNNWDSLDPAKAGFVPANGVILPSLQVGFYQGETVFHVLSRVCSSYGIQLEYSWTPIYDSYYIEGINHLYEFDCGPESGWMYKVNGWFPNYGCSSYALSGGEDIVWCYTCVGLGADVGGGNW